MSLRDTAYDGILANLPTDESARHRYFDLVEIWEHMGDHRPEHREWYDANEQAKLKDTLSEILSPREMAFFNEPFTSNQKSYNSILQTHTTARLSKILMDRHGFKVPKEGGGLGR